MKDSSCDQNNAARIRGGAHVGLCREMHLARPENTREARPNLAVREAAFPCNRSVWGKCCGC